MRPLSGCDARRLMVEAIKNHGVDSHVCKMVATIQGITETAFYIIAVYFGLVGIKHTHQAIPCTLTADTMGKIAAITICYLFLG